MSLVSDLRVLYSLTLKPVRGKDHAARMESFYSGQAEAYDDFRKRLLKGRQEMYSAVQIPEGGTWLDMGGGTGANLEYLADRIGKLNKVYVLDLSHSLLEVAKKRIASRGWSNVETIEADGLLERAVRIGERFRQRLEALRPRCPAIQQVRILGAMIGIELSTDGTSVVNQCLQRRLLVNCTHGTVIRLLPALNLTDAQLDEGCAILEEVMMGVSSS